jgi:hypothetical protein
MKQIVLICFVLMSFNCSKDYPESFKIGTFRTTTEMNTIKYLYRNYEYQYIFSEAHPGGNKLVKITWQNSGYTLETINKTSAFDSLVQTVVLNEFDNEKSFTETTYTEGIGLKFSSTWIKIDDNPNKKLNEILKQYGIVSD